MAWLIMRKAVRTRIRTEREVRDDPDIHDWLVIFNWTRKILEIFRKLSIAMSAEFYLLLVLIWCLTTGISWIRGLFYYVVFTPNYMNLQWGPSESGSRVGREDYNTHIDTEDILERLMGFGRIVVIFKDQKRPPPTFLVRRIVKRARLLERVRGKFAFDPNAQTPTPPEPPATSEPPAVGCVASAS